MSLLLLAVAAVAGILNNGVSAISPGVTTPEAAAAVAAAGVVGAATSTGLFNIRPLSIFTGHCNASIARGATIWKPIPGVVDIFFPKVVSLVYIVNIYVLLLKYINLFCIYQCDAARYILRIFSLLYIYKMREMYIRTCSFDTV